MNRNHSETKIENGKLMVGYLSRETGKTEYFESRGAAADLIERAERETGQRVEASDPNAAMAILVGAIARMTCKHEINGAGPRDDFAIGTLAQFEMSPQGKRKRESEQMMATMLLGGVPPDFFLSREQPVPIKSINVKPPGRWHCRACHREWDGSELIQDPQSTSIVWTCGDYCCGGTCDKIKS